MSIPTFFSINPRFLIFGFFAAFFSSFGQTFFIALSGPDIRSEFNLSHGDFGLIYSSATLVSAGLLIWAGRKIDDIDLRYYTSFVCFGLALACLGMSGVKHAIWLIPMIFGLRFMGQGLLGHISAVSMARYFDQHRGKALSLASLGYPLGEAVFPSIAVAIIASFGWRQMWAGIGIMLLVVLVPFMLWLLKGHSERHRLLEKSTGTTHKSTKLYGWTRAQVLKDARFYVMLPSFLATSFIFTGLFFHQVHLIESKGWSLSIFVGFFIIYAITQIFSALMTGVLVDRYNAKCMMRFYLIPAIVGLSFLVNFDEEWAGAAFMALFGLSAGAVGVIHGAIWAEIYGIAHLGAIKAIGTTFMVLSTALSPPIMGMAIDGGVTIEVISAACAIYMVLSTTFIVLILPHIKAQTDY